MKKFILILVILSACECKINNDPNFNVGEKYNVNGCCCVVNEDDNAFNEYILMVCAGKNGGVYTINANIKLLKKRCE
jgi:hypothetical protein